MWRSVRIRTERYEQVAALAQAEGRSVANMIDRLLVRGVAVPGGRDPEPSLASGVGARASAGLPVASAPVASDEPEVSAFLALPAVDPPKQAKTPAEVAKSVPDVSFGSSLAGKFKPDPRGGKS